MDINAKKYRHIAGNEEIANVYSVDE